MLNSLLEVSIKNLFLGVSLCLIIFGLDIK